ncbi:NIF3-like protein 1 [Palaemon carinicauda]|uniref:NIF3-like protein 1 n=1 Tax=Palaemon carinicauda TaxID=392227 RepID=UPI0035B66627
MLRHSRILQHFFGAYSQRSYYSMDLQEVVKRLNNLAPTSLAESWDNVGLLLEPHSKRSVGILMLTNDLTEEVLDEAEQHNVNCILSYHPPLFRPLKRVTSKAWKERIVARCLEKGIAIYSPHTSYDALKGGVNDWLIQAFEATSVVPLQQSSQPPKHSHQITVEITKDDSGAELLGYLRQQLDKSCSLYMRNGDSSLVILCSESFLPTIVTLLSSRNNHLEFAITKLEQVPLDGYGMGRKCNLSSPVTLKEAVDKVKSHLNLPYVRLALAHGATSDSLIRSVAVCAGSGSSVLRGSKVDLWLTGEMSHHEVLDATHQGISVVLTDHSNTERGYLKVLKPRLMELFDQKIQIIISERDRDPLQVV